MENTENKPITFYDILGVDKTAPEKDIRLAYYKKIRQNPPEKFPEEAKKINGAYEVLSNETKRREYDKLLEADEINNKYGNEIKEWFDTGLKFYEEKNWKESLKYFKKILTVHANNIMARNLIAICYSNTDQYEKAIEHLNYIQNLQPDNIEIWESIGYVYLNFYEHSNNSSLLDKAESYFQKVVSLDKRQSGSFDGLAEVEIIRDNFPKALDYLESAINADNKIDITDHEFFLKKIQINAILKNLNELKKDFARIKTFITEEEISKYISYRFGSLAYQFFNQKDFYVAEILLEMAISLDYSDELERFYKETKKLRILYQELELFKDDVFIEKPFKAIIFLMVDDSLSDGEREKYYKNAIDSIDDMLRYGYINEIKTSIIKINSHYPSLFNMNPELLREIAKIAEFTIPFSSHVASHNIITFKENWNCGHSKYPWHEECPICLAIKKEKEEKERIKREKLNSLDSEIHRFLKYGELEKALKLLEEYLSIEPNDSMQKDLKKDIISKITEKRKLEKLNQLEKDIQHSLKIEDLYKTQNLLNEYLSIEPQNTEKKRLSLEISEKIEEKNKKETLNNLDKEIQEYINNNDFKNAVLHLDRYISIEPKPEKIKQRDEINQQLEKQINDKKQKRKKIYLLVAAFLSVIISIGLLMFLVILPFYTLSKHIQALNYDSGNELEQAKEFFINKYEKTIPLLTIMLKDGKYKEKEITLIQKKNVVQILGKSSSEDKSVIEILLKESKNENSEIALESILALHRIYGNNAKSIQLYIDCSNYQNKHVADHCYSKVFEYNGDEKYNNIIEPFLIQRFSANENRVIKVFKEMKYLSNTLQEALKEVVVNNKNIEIYKLAFLILYKNTNEEAKEGFLDEFIKKINNKNFQEEIKQELNYKIQEKKLQEYFQSIESGNVIQIGNIFWKKCIEGQEEESCAGEPKQYSLEEAQKHCNSLNIKNGYANLKGWRLPAIEDFKDFRSCILKELDACKDEQNQTLQQFIQFHSQLKQHYYWSNTTEKNGSTTTVWLFSFDAGSNQMSDKNYLKCITSEKDNYSLLSTEKTGNIVSKKGIDVYSGPGIQYNSIGYVPSYKKIKIISTSGNLDLYENILARWYKIQYNNEERWIFGGFVNVH